MTSSAAAKSLTFTSVERRQLPKWNIPVTSASSGIRGCRFVTGRFHESKNAWRDGGGGSCGCSGWVFRRIQREHPEIPAQGDDCGGRDCSIVIKFACGVFTCEAYPDKEVVLTDPNHKIEFEVDSTTTHEFDTDGIKFTSSNSTGWFPCQAQGKTKYKCDIKDKTPAGLYKYRILIKGLSEVDPWVVNY